MLMSDNFDYQSIVDDLVPGVLSEQDLGSTIFVHEVARVRALSRYGRHQPFFKHAEALSSMVERCPGAWECLQGYMQRVDSLDGYVGMLEDIVGRWAYPWVPDNNTDEKESCRFNRGIYV